MDALNLQEKRKKSANIAFALDMLHIVVGILIVIFAVLAFLNPDENRILFPVIFLLAAVLNFANGYDRYRRGRGRKHLRTGGMIPVSYTHLALVVERLGAYLQPALLK